MTADPWPEAHVIDTSGPLGDSLRHALAIAGPHIGPDRPAI